MKAPDLKWGRWILAGEFIFPKEEMLSKLTSG